MKEIWRRKLQCKYCKKIFFSKRNKLALYCSPKCNTRKHRERRKEFGLKDRITVSNDRLLNRIYYTVYVSHIETITAGVYWR